MIYALCASLLSILVLAVLLRRAYRQRDQAQQRWLGGDRLLQRSRAEVARLVAGLSGASDGLIVLDEQGHVVAINPAAREFAGLSTADVHGVRLEELLPWPRLHDALFRCRRDGVGQAFVIEEEVDGEPGGRTLAVRVHALAEHGAVIGIDDQSRLRRLESLRRDFVANVSHELKTPLAAIQGFVETMQDDTDMPAATRHRFLERIARQSERLATLVKDLLTLSRLDDEGGQREAEPCDLVAVLGETLRDLQPIAESREIELRQRLPQGCVWVRGDREALRQMAGNLVDNALKYTPERGSVTVSLVTDGARIRLEVADTGIGLSPADQERIFERFYRVDRARSRELGGTGLGLSIVKNTARNLGGDVGVNSELGVGSLFWVELPSERVAG